MDPVGTLGILTQRDGPKIKMAATGDGANHKMWGSESLHGVVVEVLG